MEETADKPAALTTNPSARGFLLALGHDPDTHQGFRTELPWPGLKVVDADGAPVRFYTERTLKKLQKDGSFSRDVARHMDREKYPAEPSAT